MSDDLDLAAKERQRSVAKVNVALSALEGARARVQRARSELGTAKTELARLTTDYTTAVRELLQGLPDPGGDIRRARETSTAAEVEAAILLARSEPTGEKPLAMGGLVDADELRKAVQSPQPDGGT
jgi:uncharacterized membrane protein YccC